MGSEPVEKWESSWRVRHAEMLRAGGAAALLWLQYLLYSIWNTGFIPNDCRRGVLVWKGKRDTQSCNDCSRFTLLSVPGKVLARSLLDRVRQKLLPHQVMNSLVS